MRAQPLEIVLHFQLENCCCCTLCCVFLYCFSPTPCLPFTLLLLLLIFWLCSFSKPPFLSFGPNNWVWVGRTTTTKTITTTTRAAIWRGNCIVTHCFCLYLSLYTCVCVFQFFTSTVYVCVCLFFVLMPGIGCFVCVDVAPSPELFGEWSQSFFSFFRSLALYLVQLSRSFPLAQCQCWLSNVLSLTLIHSHIHTHTLAYSLRCLRHSPVCTKNIH